MTLKTIRKLLAEPDVECVEMRPDGTIVVHKRTPVYVPTPYADPWPFMHNPPTITWSADNVEPCMWDGVPPGQPMGMVCPCRKCSPQCATSTLTVVQ